MLPTEGGPPAWYAAERRQWRVYRLVGILCVILSLIFGMALAYVLNRLAATTYGAPPTTLVIALDGPLTGLVPGDERKGRVELSNTGTDRVAYTIRTLSSAHDPDLTDRLEIAVSEAADAACVALSGRVLYEGPLPALVIPNAAVSTEPGATARLCFVLRLPRALGNAYQGASDDLGIYVMGSAAPR